jgi:hypothetical protein
MIVVVLAVVWVVALTPMVLRRISERQFTAGVRNYHRRLLRLGSAGQSAAATERSSGSVPGAMIGFSVAAQRLHVERYGAPAPAPSLEIDEPAQASSSPVQIASPATAARRRQVVSVLAGATLFFFVVGIIPALRIMWDLGLVGIGCTAAYVALLIHFHRLAVERAQKVIALETRRHATEVLESRRHVVALDRAQQAIGGYRGAHYAGGGHRYAGAAAPVMSGSGWSVMATQPRQASHR